MKKKIAIIGTGISGLTAAYVLHRHHDVHVYEANDYIGGHTATKAIEHQGQEYFIDTGFIVFNNWTYPSFTQLLSQLNVAAQATQMSFSVTNPTANLEYNGHTLGTLFAQRRNLLRPKFWRIVLDILRFNKRCKALAAEKIDVGTTTLYEFIQAEGLSDDFANNYILPMCAAIWSSSMEETKAFPLKFFLQFFNNHGLLNIKDRPQWYSLIGGSHSYIEPITAGYRQQIYCQTPVQAICRNNEGVTITSKRGEEHYDEVIIACHSDQALQLLAQPSEAEQAILGAIPYAKNEVVIHTDTSILPQRRKAWASWNYHIPADVAGLQQPATLTYNMNILQCLSSPTTFCVTLNATDQIDCRQILGTFHYAHPQYSLPMVAAQGRRHEICGQQHTHYCGAYWYNGFHEDGVRSALDVCQLFGLNLDNCRNK